MIFLSPEPTVTKEEATRRQNRSSNNKEEDNVNDNTKPVTEGIGIPYQTKSTLH